MKNHCPLDPKTTIVLSLLSFLYACATSHLMPPPYHPGSISPGYVEKGIASWYGPGFHGRRTANGEVYNMYAFTAAHKYLPFNTLVKVVNLSNHRSVIVRINDRGPFVKDRIIDLSYAAAKKLGILKTGTAPVLIEVVGVGGSHVIFPRGYFVQVGAFSSRDNAMRVYLYLKKQGYTGSLLVRVRKEGGYIWRVQAGEFPTLAVAKRAMRLLGRKFPSCFILAR